MKHLQKQSGFTLLELLIVIIIVSILALLIIPNIISGPERSRDTQRKNDLRAIKQSLETYYNDNNSYPTAGGTNCTPSVPTCLGTTLAPAYDIKQVPSDPKQGKKYVYTPSPANCAAGACVSYTLTATLENTKDPQATGGVYTVSSAN